MPEKKEVEKDESSLEKVEPDRAGLELEGKVEVKKKTLGRRILDTFVGSDMHDVRSYLVQDIVVPAIKETVTNLVSSTLEMMFYGDSRGDRTVRRGRDRNYTSYSGYSRRDSRPPFEPDRPVRSRGGRRMSQDVSSVTFTSKRDAQKVWNNLIDRTYEYDEGVATVADFCDEANIDYAYTDNGYGWLREDLLRGEIIGPRNGIYRLKLPRPRPLD